MKIAVYIKGMKTKKYFIKFVILLTVLLANLCLQNLNAEENISLSDFFMPNFTLRQSIEYRGFASTDLKLSSPVLSNFVKIKTADVVPKLKLRTEGFALRFSPLLYQEKKEFKPALSFFYGGLNIAGYIKKFTNPDFSIKDTNYSGIRFFPDNLIETTNAKKEVSKACEFSIKNFNAIILAEQKIRSKWATLHFAFVYKSKNLQRNKNNNTEFGISLYSCLYPSLHSKLKVFLPNYNQVYVADAIFINENKTGKYKLKLSGGLNLASGDNKEIKKNKAKLLKTKIEKPTFNSNFEFNYIGKYFSLNTGVQIKQKDFFTISRKKTKEKMLTFFQAKAYIGIFEFSSIYNFSQNYNFKNQKNYNLHSGGISLNLTDKKYSIKSHFFYKQDKYFTSVDLAIKDLAYWQNLIFADCKFILEDKKHNPFVIKKYASNFLFKINCTENIKVEFFTKIEQENKVIKEKNQLPRITWQKLKSNIGIGLDYEENYKFIKHKLDVKIGIKNFKEDFFFKLRYTMSSKK